MSSLRTIIHNKSYLSVAMIFVSLNILMGTWAIYIPSIKADLGISESELGIALFFFAFGTFCVLPIAPKLISKIGVGKTSFLGITLHSLSFILPFYVQSLPQLCVALFVAGITGGLTDIAINTTVAQYEKKDKVLIMSGVHGFFSFGGVIGSGIGILTMYLFIGPQFHMIWVAIGVIALNLFFAKHYISEKTVEDEVAGKFNFNLFRTLFVISLIGFVTMAGEGSIADWSALFLEQICNAEAGLLGLGYALFSIFMTLGRFFGDVVSKKLGSIKTISYGCLIAALAIGLVLTGNLIITLIGFSLVGIGFSVVVPELFRLGGQTPGVNPAQGIAFIAGVGYAGFVLGPVVLGAIAGKFDLRASFLFLLIVISIVTFISFRIRKEA